MTAHALPDAAVAGVLVTLLVWGATSPWWAVRATLTGAARGRTGARLGREAEPPVHLAVLLDLLRAALGSGAGVPQALAAVGRSVGGADGAALERTGTALLLGAGWESSWGGTSVRLAPVAEALRPAWVHGAPPGHALRVAGAQLVREERSRSRAGAARLGVRLVLPLGLCLLPAFVLLGLVPVMVALGTGLGSVGDLGTGPR